MAQSIRSILLVDDNPDDIEFIQDLVNHIEDEFQYMIHSAEDGPVALEVYQTVALDCAIVDYSMPGMNGTAVIECLAKLNSPKNPDNKLPVILMSGLPDEEMQLIIQHHPNTRHTTKENLWNSRKLKQIIDQLLM